MFGPVTTWQRRPSPCTHSKGEARLRTSKYSNTRFRPLPPTAGIPAFTADPQGASASAETLACRCVSLGTYCSFRSSSSSSTTGCRPCGEQRWQWGSEVCAGRSEWCNGESPAAAARSDSSLGLGWMAPKIAALHLCIALGTEACASPPRCAAAAARPPPQTGGARSCGGSTVSQVQGREVEPKQARHCHV